MPPDDHFLMEVKRWVLCECGFDQLLFTKGRTESCIRTVCSFDSEPSLSISSVWDAIHLFAESAKPNCVTLGRWEKAVKQLENQFQGEQVSKVMEVNDKIVMKITNKKIMISSWRGNDQVSMSELDTPPESPINDILSTEGGSKMYALLQNGNVHPCAFTSDSTLSLRSPVLGTAVKQVACGSDHLLLVGDASGRVWSLGLNHRGQLGHGDLQSRTQPCIIEALDGLVIKEVACGLWHSLALSQYGDVYSWGWNAHKQLGHSSDLATVATPAMVEVDEEVEFKCVQCGARHSAALSVCGKLWMWGWNGYGQLGHYRTTTGTPTPVCMAAGLISWIHCTPWSTLFLQKKNEPN